MDLAKYWKQVGLLAEQLPAGEVVTLCSIDNEEKGTKAGAIVECERKLGAQRIVEKTHRLATAEEIAKELARSEKQLERDRARGIRRAPKTVLLQTGPYQPPPPAVLVPAAAPSFELETKAPPTRGART